MSERTVDEVRGLPTTILDSYRVPDAAMHAIEEAQRSGETSVVLWPDTHFTGKERLLLIKRLEVLGFSAFNGLVLADPKNNPVHVDWRLNVPSRTIPPQSTIRSATPWWRRLFGRGRPSE